MYFLLNLSHYVKSYGHLCQNLAFLSMITHQIWTSHATDEHCKYCKVSEVKVYSFRSYQQKTSRKVENIPPLVVLLEQTLYTLDIHVYMYMHFYMLKYFL